MNYGLYLSAAGVLNNLQRQDVIANNLANVNTVGFKPDSVLTRHRLPERLESGHLIEPREMLERLGAGCRQTPPSSASFRATSSRRKTTWTWPSMARAFFSWPPKARRRRPPDSPATGA